MRTFIDTTNVGDSRWRPPLVAEDWHAVRSRTARTWRCTERSISKKKKRGVNKKARALWALRDAEEKGSSENPGGERQIESRTSVRRALWEVHMKSRTAALEEALRRTEDGQDGLRPLSQGEAKRERRFFVFLDFGVS